MAGKRKATVDLLGRIAEFLADRDEGADAAEIADRFFRMPGADERAAAKIVDPLLRGDRRFARAPGGRWITAVTGPVAAPDDRAPAPDLFAAARPAVGVPGLFLVGLVRAEGERETGSFAFPARPREGAPPPERADALARGARLVVWSVASPFASIRASGLLAESEPVRLRALAAPFAPNDALRTPERLARHLGAPVIEGDGDPVLDARLLHALSLRVEERWGARSRPPGREETEIPFLREGGEEYLAALPERPGIYRMRDDDGRVLYIGKSRSLRARVESYFRSYRALSGEKKEMVRRVSDIEVMILGSEAEALLEEWRHIRRRRPPYNEKIEVRGAPSPAVAGRNLILFLPSTDDGSVTLFLLRAGGATRRLRARRNPVKTARLAADVAAFFRGEGGTEEEGAYALLSRWIEENRDRVTLLDADRYRDPGDLLRVVVDCLRDPEITAGRRIDPL